MNLNLMVGYRSFLELQQQPYVTYTSEIVIRDLHHYQFGSLSMTTDVNSRGSFITTDQASNSSEMRSKLNGHHRSCVLADIDSSFVLV